MGASNCRSFDAVKKELTDKEWSELMGKYVRIENKDIEADLIYQFDGKSVLGPANNDPLRCRKTGRALKHRGAYKEVMNGGGLTSLSIMNPQEARVSTGEIAWLDQTNFCVSIEMYAAHRTTRKKERNRKRPILVGGVYLCMLCNCILLHMYINLYMYNSYEIYLNINI